MVTRWSALTAAVALFVGLGLLGDTPDTRDSTGQVAGYFVSHSASVLAGAATPRSTALRGRNGSISTRSPT